MNAIAVNDIYAMIANAEKLRNDQQQRLAIELFKKVERDPRFNGLTQAQKRYVWAHHGVAENETHVAHQEGAVELDEAEKLIKLALNLDGKLTVKMIKDSPMADPWAWAHLGEVLRNKGNLPALSVARAGNSLAFQMSDGQRQYELSEACFDKAIPSNARAPYPWALAHKGALLINQRRFYEGRMGISKPKEAIERLESALVATRYNYPWAMVHLSLAQFISGLIQIESMLLQATSSRAARSEVEPPPTWDDIHSKLTSVSPFIFSVYSALMAMYQDPPKIYENPVQPGAVAMDPYFAVTYDLLDFSAISAAAMGAFEEADKDDFRSKFFDEIKQILKMDFPSADPFLPESSRLRRLYVELYVKFLRGYPKADKEALAKLRDRIIEQAKEILEKPFMAAPGALPVYSHDGLVIRILDTMVLLIKMGAILKTSGVSLEHLPDIVAQYNQKLGGVLKGDPERAMSVIMGVVNLFRLLHPVMNHNPIYDQVLKLKPGV